MTSALTVECNIQVRRRAHGRNQLSVGEGADSNHQPCARVPRIAKLMALAIHFQNLVQAGEVVDYADLARLGQVSRARITQIMNLLLLAPDIQEEILFLPQIASGRDTLFLRDLQPIAASPNWRKQRDLWKRHAALTNGPSHPLSHSS